MPSSPRGWFCKAIYTLDSQGRPFSQFDRIRGTGPRYSREEALSVKIIAERASRECTANGVGYELLERFYLGEAPWFSFHGTGAGNPPEGDPAILESAPEGGISTEKR